VRNAANRSWIRDPARAAVVTAGALTLIGSSISWASAPGLFDDVTFTPIVRNTGPILVVATLILVPAALNRSVSETRVRTLQALPGILAVVLVLGWLETWRDLGNFLKDPLDLGIRTDGPLGPLLSATGVVTLAAAGLRLSATSWRRSDTASDPAAGLPARAAVLRGFIELAGGAIGSIGALAAVIASVQGMFVLPLLIVVVLFGGATGVWVGRRAALLALPETGRR